jgi:hypothetical protein
MTIKPAIGAIRTGWMALHRRSSTMKTTRTLMLAGMTALSLGMGTAMAQSVQDQNALTWTNRGLLGASSPAAAAAAATSQPQAGSSDVDGTQTSSQHFPAWVGYGQVAGAAAGS